MGVWFLPVALILFVLAVFLLGGLPILLAAVSYSKIILITIIAVILWKLGFFDWVRS